MACVTRQLQRPHPSHGWLGLLFWADCPLEKQGSSLLCSSFYQTRHIAGQDVRCALEHTVPFFRHFSLGWLSMAQQGKCCWKTAAGLGSSRGAQAEMFLWVYVTLHPWGTLARGPFPGDSPPPTPALSDSAMGTDSKSHARCWARSLPGGQHHRDKQFQWQE